MNQELRIKLQSYDHRLLEQSVRRIIGFSKENAINVLGPIPLPTKRELFTVLRSPHVNKDSREQFERRTHKRLIILKSFDFSVIDQLKKIIIPSGVELKIKVKA